MIKRLVVTCTAVATFALAGCGGSDNTSSSDTTGPTTAAADTTSSTATPSGSTGSTASTAATATTVKVNIAGYNFSPSTLTVKVGTTVTWTNKDSVTHTVTSGASRTADGKFDKSLAPDETFSYTFDTPGTYAYYCKPHVNMVASIIVQ